MSSPSDLPEGSSEDPRFPFVEATLSPHIVGSEIRINGDLVHGLRSFAIMADAKNPPAVLQMTYIPRTMVLEGSAKLIVGIGPEEEERAIPFGDEDLDVLKRAYELETQDEDPPESTQAEGIRSLAVRIAHILQMRDPDNAIVPRGTIVEDNSSNHKDIES